jgi:hypothetical protein
MGIIFGGKYVWNLSAAPRLIKSQSFSKELCDPQRQSRLQYEKRNSIVGCGKAFGVLAGVFS